MLIRRHKPNRDGGKTTTETITPKPAPKPAKGKTK